MIKPSNIPLVLTKFTVDTFPDGNIHFLHKIVADGTDIYHKDTHTGQYTHKTAWIKSLFNHGLKICGSRKLFKNQISFLKSCMSWNGYPNSVKYFLINKLKCKYNASTVKMNRSCNDDNLPKILMRIPFLGKQSENLVKSCILKILHHLNQPIKFIVTYDMKKVSYFISNKDKIPEMPCNNVIYQITCPGCNKTYIGKTNCCLHKHLSKHST